MPPLSVLRIILEPIPGVQEGKVIPELHVTPFAVELNTMLLCSEVNSIQCLGLVLCHWWNTLAAWRDLRASEKAARESQGDIVGFGFMIEKWSSEVRNILTKSKQ